MHACFAYWSHPTAILSSLFHLIFIFWFFKCNECGCGDWGGREVGLGGGRKWKLLLSFQNIYSTIHWIMLAFVCLLKIFKLRAPPIIHKFIPLLKEQQSRGVVLGGSGGLNPPCWCRKLANFCFCYCFSATFCVRAPLVILIVLHHCGRAYYRKGWLKCANLPRAKGRLSIM